MFHEQNSLHLSACLNITLAHSIKVFPIKTVVRLHRDPRHTRSSSSLSNRLEPTRSPVRFRSDFQRSAHEGKEEIDPGNGPEREREPCNFFSSLVRALFFPNLSPLPHARARECEARSFSSQIVLFIAERLSGESFRVLACLCRERERERERGERQR